MASRSLGTLTLDLVAKIGGFERGLDKAGRHADKRLGEIERRAAKFGKFIGTAIAAGAGAAVAGLIAVTKNAIDSADRLNDISKRLGVSTEALSAWGYAAKQSGTDMEALNTGLTRFTKNVAAAAESGSRQGEIFEALGISVKDAAGNLRSVEDLLPEIATAFKEMDNATLESALSMELFGKSGAQLLQFLNLGGQGLDDMAEKARALGIVVSGQTAEAADEFNDQLEDLKSIMAGVGLQLAADLLPALSDFIDTVKKSAQEGGLLHFVMKDISGSAQDLANLLQDVSNKADYTAERFKAMAHVMSAAGAIMTGQFAKAQAEYAAGQALIDSQMAPRRTGPVPDLKVPFLQPLFPQLEFRAAPNSLNPQGAPAGSSSAERALNALLAGGNTKTGGGGRKGKNEAAEALKEQARAAKEAKDELDRLVKETIEAHGAFDAMAATLAGPMAEANFQYIKDQKRLNELAKAGEVSTEELATAQNNLRIAHEKNVAAINAQLTPSQEVIAGLREEIMLLGMSDIAQQKLIATKQAGAEATAAEVEEIERLIEVREQAAKAADLQREIESGLADAIFDVASGAKSAGDAVKDFFDDLAKYILRMIAENWAKQIAGLFTGSGGSSGGGESINWVATIANIFGGARASGGATKPNTLYRVNENGTEMLSIGGRDYLMMGSQAGNVTPNSQLTNGGGVVQNIQFNVAGRVSDETRSQAAAKIGYETRRATARN